MKSRNILLKTVVPALCGALLVICVVFFLGWSKAANSSTAQPEVRNSGTAIQWKYADEGEWHDLVALTELRGAAGENGKDGADGVNGADGKDGTNGINGADGRDGVNGRDGNDGVDGKNGTDGADGKDGINGADGKNGVDGKTIEVQKTDLYVQWRYEGEAWQNLVALADITGPAGQKGADGVNGKTPEFRVDETILQWRYVGDKIWLNLYDLSALQGLDGKDGQKGADGKDGNTPFIGENGNWWIDTMDTGIQAKGVDGTNGVNGIDGSDGKQIEIQKTDLYIQWRYEGEEWQNLVALADIAGPSGQSGTNGENGKTPEFRVNGNQLQWRYAGDTTWLNLYDLSALRGADGKNGANGKNGVDGQDGKDGICAGYFAANGSVYSAGKALPFTVKQETGGLISYNASSNKITLSKGHTYSLVFSGTVAVSANGDDATCGVSLVDGYNSSEMILETQTCVIVPKASQTARLSMSYNTIYKAEEDITLTFQYSKMLFQDTNFKDSRYSTTIIALD